MNSSSDVYFAKTIFFGDNSSGRGTLIYNLDYYKPPGIQTTKQYNDHFFIPVELSSYELESNNNEVATLKIWKYSNHLSKRDEENACHAALFSIIVFNITNAESYKNVFEKWLPLKEQLCPESFVYIVGTHSDHNQYRAVEIPDICKQCAKKDAVYIEVSNEVGTNIPLLRKLLCKRVQYILYKKEELLAHPLQPKYLNNPNDPHGQEENKAIDPATGLPTSRGLSFSKNDLMGGNDGSNVTGSTILEPSIIMNNQNIGSIYASFLDAEAWQGFERHEEELQHLAVRIDDLIDNLAKDIENPTFDLNNFRIADIVNAKGMKPDSSLDEDNTTEDLETDIKQLQDAFKVLGLSLPPLPNVPAALQPPGAPSTANNNTSHTPNSPLNATNTAAASSAAAAVGGNNGVDGNNNTATNTSNTAGSNTTTTATANANATNNAPTSTLSNLRKMMIKLPPPVSRSVEMILDLDVSLDQQVDMFLMTYSLAHDQEIRKKLLSMFVKIQKEYLNSNPNRPRTLSKTPSNSLLK